MVNACLIQEVKDDWQHLLGLLLSMELYNSSFTTCHIYCDENTKNKLESFPKLFTFNIKYNIIIDHKISNVSYMKLFINSIKNVVENYGECLFINSNLIMLNSFTISEKIKTNGIGFIKKEFECTDEMNHTKYLFELLYINNIEHIGIIINYFKERLDGKNILELDLKEVDKDIIDDMNKKCVDIYAKIPEFIANECMLDDFIDNNTCIGTEDFFAFSDSISIKDINMKNLNLNDNPISFINLRVNSVDKNIQSVNKILLNIIVNRNVIYMNIINLKMCKTKITLVVPDKHGVSIWNRENDVSGLYDLFELMSNNSDYVNIEVAKIDYFTIGNYMITDKPSRIWLNNNITKYSGIFISNYDDSLISELEKLKKPTRFLCYYSSFPKKYEQFVENHDVEKNIDLIVINNGDDINYEFSKGHVINKTYDLITDDETIEERDETIEEGDETIEERDETIEERDDKYVSYLNEISEARYALVEKHDVTILAELLGLGIIPIISHDTKIFDLEENVHYIRNDNMVILEEEEENRIRENCIKYYNDNIKSTSVLKLLINHIFVWDF